MLLALKGRNELFNCLNKTSSSAVAAATKGYSRQPDSARIVHVLHMVAASLGARIWFEYVRTKANVADEPSRIDLAGAVYDIGADMPAEVGAALRSAEQR